MPLQLRSRLQRGAERTGRWSYIYGDLGTASVEDLLAGAGRYAATPDGLVPWRERPTIFRKGVIARLPPIPKPVQE